MAKQLPKSRPATPYMGWQVANIISSGYYVPGLNKYFDTYKEVIEAIDLAMKKDTTKTIIKTRGRPKLMKKIYHAKENDLDSWDHSVKNQKFVTSFYSNSTQKTILNPKRKGMLF